MIWRRAGVIRVATIVDVAAEAGVSVSTVSRHLRGERVRAAESIDRSMSDLGFRPSPAAQALKSGRTGAIALVVPDVANPFFAAVVRGAESVAVHDGYTVFLANTDESEERETKVVNSLIGRVDGMLLTPASESDPNPQRLADRGVPLVLIDRESAPPGTFDTVLVDNGGGARIAVEHLISHGHERIATIAGPVTSTPGRLRFDGYREALESHGIELRAELCQLGDFKRHGGYQAMMRILGLADPPTAVFVANNLMTIGALYALRDLGVRVPADISIIGFDDHVLAEIISPPLTVIDRPMEEQGVLAMRLLTSRLRGANTGPARRVMLDTRLLERDSCGPPRTQPMPTG